MDRTGGTDRIESAATDTASIILVLGNSIPFRSEELQKLLALRFDGYEDMSISEYQSRVWALTDTDEAMDLLERFFQNDVLYGCRDNNEIASFLFYILQPLISEKWQKQEFGGAAATDYPDAFDNAMLEYTIVLMVQDPKELTVREYDRARVGMENGLKSILTGRTDGQLRDESFMQEEIHKEVDRLVKEWGGESLQISVEFVYTPLSRPELEGYVQSIIWQEQQGCGAEKLEGGGETGAGMSEDGGEYESGQERRRFPNGTQADYQSLLSLKLWDYEDMELADFNMELLRWANENHERMERINCDTAYDDFQVPLTEEERRFVTLSVNFSGIENAKYVRSNYMGREEEPPSYDVDLQKTDEKGGRGAWCELYYRFVYQIEDKQRITVGDRDRCIEGVMNGIQEFWEKTEIDDLLNMEKEEIVKKLQGIAESYSTKQLTVTIPEDQVFFECMDERDEVFW